MAFLFALLGHWASALCGTPQLVRNINTTVAPASSNPQYLGDLGGKILFGATDAVGAGLWITDGTSSGTVLLTHVNVSPQKPFPGSPPNFLVLNGRGYFVGDNGTTGPQLWTTDGTASGTVMVANLGPSGTTAPPLLYGAFGSLVIFSKVDASGTAQLYATDGTSAGTAALTSLTGQNSFVSREFLIAGSKFYFATGAVSQAAQIWASDGTPGGTHLVTNPSNYFGALNNPQFFTPVGTRFLYVSQDLLWSVDTTSDTISAVTASGGVDGFGPPMYVSNLVAENGYALFLAGGMNGLLIDQELWSSDGTSAGTYRVAVINPGPQLYSLFQKVGNRVIFIGSDAQYGPQLWGSDGTAANTGRLTDATAPANSPYPTPIYHATLGNTAYVSLPNGAQSTTWSVWRTDGTAGGTRPLNGLPPIDQSEAGLTSLVGDDTIVYVRTGMSPPKDALFGYDPVADTTTVLNASLSPALPDAFFFDAGRLFFASNDPVTGDEPWISSDTAGSTRLLTDINPQTSDIGSDPDEFVNYNGNLTFVADDGVHGRELWTSDGTAAGTQLLYDVNPGAASSNPSHLFVAGGVLYFFATDASGAQAFMRVSGSPASVATLASIAPPAPPYGLPAPVCRADIPVALNGKVYFAATDGVSGVELWSTDGTAAGTQRVTDINPGAGASNPCWLTVLGNQLFFSAQNTAGVGLWVSDGSSGGTTQVTGSMSGAAFSQPSGLLVFNGRLWFDATTSGGGGQLWQSDGTSSGTFQVANIAQNANTFAYPYGAVNNRLFINALTAQTQPIGFDQDLWSSDGTSAGTIPLGTVLTGPLLGNGALAYFSGSGTVGPEPWISDGTVAGTHLLKDVNPTAQSSLSWFANFNGTTLFAMAGATDRQLWRSDGTSSGTVLIAQIPPDIQSPASTLPSDGHQLAVGQSFFFVANDPATGSELYALANAPPVANPDQASSANDQAVQINVLGNDADSDGTLDHSSVEVISTPGHGTAAAQPDGTIVYTPAMGFAGTDSFAYTVKDSQGAASNSAVVTVSVTAPATPGATKGGGSFDIPDLLGLLLLAGWKVSTRRKAMSP